MFGNDAEDEPDQEGSGFCTDGPNDRYALTTKNSFSKFEPAGHGTAPPLGQTGGPRGGTERQVEGFRGVRAVPERT